MHCVHAGTDRLIEENLRPNNGPLPGSVLPKLNISQNDDRVACNGEGLSGVTGGEHNKFWALSILHPCSCEPI